MNSLKKDNTLDQLNPAIAVGYYADLAKAKDIDDLNNRITHIITRLGFTHYCYRELDRTDSEQLLLSVLPKPLLQTYYDKALHQLDMTLQTAKCASHPFYSSTVHDYIVKAPFTSDMTQAMETIYELYKFYGFYDFYNVFINQTYDEDTVILSVTQRGVSAFEFINAIAGRESTLKLLCGAINHTIKNNFPTYRRIKEQPVTISPKALRVVNALANNDMTINQVADKLCISVVTANQHLKTIRQKLGTKTNYAAIKKAILKKYISFEPIQDPNEDKRKDRLT